MDSSKMILIADDNASTRYLIRLYLEKVGYTIIEASDGKKTLAMLSDEINVVLLDLNMPEISGMDCLSHISQNYNDIRTIVITASNDISDAVEAMKIGAFDYLIKPLKRDVLLALVNQAVKMNAQSKHLRKVENELQKAREQEIFIASRIQQSLLLGAPPKDIKKIQVSHLTIASQKVDGDFFDFFKQSEHCFDLVLGDVMGKGIPAALLGAALKNHLLRVMNELIRGRDSNQLPLPEEIVTALHAEMIDKLEELETFVTLCYSRFDMMNYEFSFVDCGHMRTIHFHNEENKTVLLQGINMPLGFPEQSPFRQVLVPFKEKDIFFFYSDGLTEAKNQQGELYGEERLLNFVIKNVAAGPEGLTNGIWQEIVDFSESENFEDDFTSIAVEIKLADTLKKLTLSREELRIKSDLKELANVRNFIREFCMKIPDQLITVDRIFRIELAANEATANIIKHAYHGKTDKFIQIVIETSETQITVNFFDNGDVFDTEAIQQPMFDGSKDGGFGVYIIADCVDDVKYSRDKKGRNCTCLKINFSGV